MREKLKSLTEEDYWTYGLSEGDFDYTFSMVTKFIDSLQEKIRAEIEQAKIDYPREDIWGEIQSDLAHYAWVDEQNLWQFCLLRIQGIFEGLITYSFLSQPPKERLIGLKKKLEAAKSAGFTLTDEEYNELISWGDLRNSLSHAPPEQFHLGPVHKEDIIEYIDFIKSICVKWNRIKNTHSPQS